MFISNAFAQTAAPAAADGPTGSMTNVLMMVAMFAVLYFIMIRPQMKKQKEHRAMVEALAKGDEVVTAGGLMGQVTSLSESDITLQIATGVEVRIQRSYVTQVLPKGTLK